MYNELMASIRILLVIILISCGSNTKSDEGPLGPTQYEAVIVDLYNRGSISKRNLLDYLTYPSGKSEIEAQGLDFHRSKIDLKASMIRFNKKICLNNSICSTLDTLFEENPKEYLVTMTTTNFNKADVRLDTVVLKVHLSHFEFGAKLVYTSFEKTQVQAGGSATNTLYIPKDLILDHITLNNKDHLPLSFKDYFVELADMKIKVNEN